MKQITLSIDDALFSNLQRSAEEQQCSVDDFVNGCLAKMTTEHNGVQQARQKIRELSQNATAQLGSKNWSRSELHER